MFGLFKKKTKVEKLQEKFSKLSTTNRSESDKKYAEADEIAKQIETLKSNNS